MFRETALECGCRQRIRNTPELRCCPGLQLAELAASEDPRPAVVHFRAVDVEADDQDEDGLPWEQVKKFRVRRQTLNCFSGLKPLHLAWGSSNAMQNALLVTVHWSAAVCTLEPGS